MKYIMFRKKMGQSTTKLIPVIFPDIMVHLDVYDALRRMEGFELIEVASAGSISLGDVTCHGESETLKVKSKDKLDDKIIDTYDYMHGIGFEEVE